MAGSVIFLVELTLPVEKTFMQGPEFLKFAGQIIVKDWKQHGKAMLGTVTGMALGILFVRRFGPDQAIAKGIVIGAGVVCPYGFSQLCFFIERQHGLLKKLMMPPITPRELLLAKYGSAFSMAIFVVSVPAMLFWDVGFLCYINIAVLFLTSICMLIAVVSDLPWATLVPIWIVLFPYLYARSWLDTVFPFVRSHTTAVCIAGLSLIPVIVYASLRRFEMDTALDKHRNR